MTQTPATTTERWIAGAPASRTRAADALARRLRAAGATRADVPYGGRVIIAALGRIDVGALSGECAITPLDGGAVQIAPHWGAGQEATSSAQRRTARWVAEVLRVPVPGWARAA